MKTLNAAISLLNKPLHTNETFIPVKDFPDYWVSDYGRVLSWKLKVPKILTPAIDAGGYSHYRLYVENKAKLFKGHRLVALHFIPTIDHKEEINHLNGLKIDNRVENLEWCNRQENMKHAYDNHLRQGSRKINSNRPIRVSTTDGIQVTFRNLKEVYNFFTKFPVSLTIQYL